MKIILLLILISLSGIIGYGISFSYKQRYNFFYSLSIFLQNLKTDINFLSTKLLNILDKTSKNINNNDLTSLLNNFTKLIKEEECINVQSLFKGISFLIETEKEQICLFFKNLGKTDAINQIEVISNMQNTVSDYLTCAKKDCDKYCSLYTKLGVLFGLFVCLVIV